MSRPSFERDQVSIYMSSFFKDLSFFKQFKEMTNNELTIDETTALTHTNELKNKTHNNQIPITVSRSEGGGGGMKRKKNKNRNKNKYKNNKPQ